MKFIQIQNTFISIDEISNIVVNNETKVITIAMKHSSAKSYYFQEWKDYLDANDEIHSFCESQGVRVLSAFALAREISDF